MSEIKTYDEMNKQICGLLRLAGDNVSLYAAQRITELEAENADLSVRLENTIELPCKVGDRVYGVGYTDCALQYAETKQEKQEISKVCYGMNGRCDKCKYSLPAVEEFVCTQIQIGNCGIDGVDVLVVGGRCENYFSKDICKTPEEAKARLAEIKGGEKK